MSITARALIRIGKSAFFLTIAVAVVGAIFLFPRWSNANAPDYKLAVVERGPIVSTVTATGTINPITTVIVGSQLSGQLVEILADYNDRVTAGQISPGSIPIRSGSSAMLLKRISIRLALLRSCKARDGRSRSNPARQAAAQPTGAVSDVTYDAARTQPLSHKRSFSQRRQNRSDGGRSPSG